MRRGAFFVSFLAALLLTAHARPAFAAGKDVQKFERTLPFKAESQTIGLKVGDVTIESVEIKNWPDADDLAKGEKDPTDTKTMWVVFTYSNQGSAASKCKYTVTIPDPKGGTPWGENDSTRTLDAKQVRDTNRFPVRMKTHQYKLAKTMKISFEIWKK
jgi:hypothetical protein